MFYGHMAMGFAAKPLAPKVKLGYLLFAAALVFSHWLLDFISHPMGFGEELPPDLPLLFGNSRRIGLGLYNSLPAALVVLLPLGNWVDNHRQLLPGRITSEP